MSFNFLLLNVEKIGKQIVYIKKSALTFSWPIFGLVFAEPLLHAFFSFPMTDIIVIVIIMAYLNQHLTK